MEPDDRNGNLPLEQRHFRVLLISGSNRRQYNCPGVDSKSRTLMLRMADRLPQDWEIDLEDLGNVYGRARIQSCNACVSTSMALCVWPCNCYRPNDHAEPDLMWDLDMYARLDLADAWAFIAPVNWYGPTSSLKLMFDRLVCMNGGNPDEDTIQHKNPERAMELESSPQWNEMSRNHLEGRTAAFFCYGDAGADEIGDDERPKLLTHKSYFDPEQEPFDDERNSYAPLVWQCRFSGIEVPNNLWRYVEFGRDEPYSENQAEQMVARQNVVADFDGWVDAFANFVREKGKVPRGKYRAFGVKRGNPIFKEIPVALREVRLRLGFAPSGSSPQKQAELNLNRDITLFPKESERKRYYRMKEIARRVERGDSESEPDIR
jgi:hypothetical protein